MYVHIGADVSIPAHWIIGIFDLDHVTSADDTVSFLAHAEEAQRLDWMTPDVPRSLVVTIDRVYLSPVTAATLKDRAARRPIGIERTL
ncbi:MAG: extracellular matrix regulator RemB [Saccharofermentanales bacterium]|jgi:hypothetical protein